MKNTYYWTCPYCKANLDPGEKCDCPESLTTYGIDVDYSDVKPSISNKDMTQEGGMQYVSTFINGR